MTYAVRNTIIMAALFVVVTAGGAVWVFGPVRGALQVKQLEKETVSREITAMGDVAAMREQVTQSLEEARERWDHQYKFIAPTDNPAETYDYLNSIISRRDAGVRFSNFRSRESGGDDVLRWNKYDISGRGTFAELYGFLWHLENRRRLYRVDDLLVEQISVTDEETGVVHNFIQFSTDVTAYYMPGTEPPAAGQEFLRLGAPGRNPFRPLIQVEVPPNYEDLVEVNKSELIAIMGDAIYVRDQHGASRSLQLGDRVYLGHVAEVDRVNGRVMFKLVRAGITDYVTLGLSGLEETGEGD